MRTLVKKSELEFADVVYWQTLKVAQVAADKVMVCEVCLSYFSLMDTHLNKEMDSGFAYFEVVKNGNLCTNLSCLYLSSLNRFSFR
jgi:hypothetical protein